MDTISGYSGKYYEKIVQEKIPEIVIMVSMVPGAVPPLPKTPVHEHPDARSVPDNCQTVCDDRLPAGPLRETGQPRSYRND